MNRIVNAYLGTTGLAALALFGASAEASQPAPVSAPGVSGKVALVHKKDAEGALEIDALTGWVLTSQEDRPDWADGLVTAQLAERHIFYTNKLGEEYAEEHKFPEVYAFEDLGWLGANMEDGSEIVLLADDEFRMEVMAAVLGIDRETGSVAGQLASNEIARDETRTGAEMEALLDSQKEGFAATGTDGK